MAIYGRVFFWVFFTILSIETAILSASYLIYHVPGITIREEVFILIGFGCLLSIIIGLSIVWAINLIIAIYDRNSAIKSQEEFDLLTDLSTAIEKHELVLYFQPQANLQTNEIVGMETLLRWCHPKKGIIMPSVFIPIAEKAGLIEMITEWTMLQACIYNKKLLDNGYNLRVAVNISPLLFNDHLLIEHLSRILNASKLPAENLELEITESTMMHDVEYAITTMMQLRGLGVLLSLDDFGTGYSSLAEIDRLPVHKLKIDKAFVQNVNVHEAESSMVYSIIQMGHQLRLQIAVEGIEDAKQQEFFAQLKCHEGQGFFIGEPLPADQFLNYLTNLTRNLRA